MKRKTLLLSVVVGVAVLLVASGLGQETTGGVQGTVKDPSGAVVAKASVELTGSALVGSKKLDTDSRGYYRFANLPPGTYVLAVTAEGFTSTKRENITIEVGHLPTLDLTLQVGGSSTVVEVTDVIPLVDGKPDRVYTGQMDQPRAYRQWPHFLPITSRRDDAASAWRPFHQRLSPGVWSGMAQDRPGLVGSL